MKCLLLLVALCLAVCVCIGEEEAHWAKRLRQIAQNSDAQQNATDNFLEGLLKNSKARKGEPSTNKKLEHRYPYNPLNYTDIDTQEKLERWRTQLMSMRSETKGPNALWNKFKAQEKPEGDLQTFSAAVDLALEDVAKVIENYQESLKEECKNVNSFTGLDKEAPHNKKIEEIIATNTKAGKCLEKQKELLKLDYENEDGMHMQENDVVLATLVRNATLLSRGYTDCAANIVMLAVLKNNEQCFDKFFEDTKTLAKSVYKESHFHNTMLEIILRHQSNNQPSYIAETVAKTVVDSLYNTTDGGYFEKPEVKDALGGKMSELIGQLHPKTGSPCGKDVIKSVTEAALELDLPHDEGCLDFMQQISRHLY